MKGNMKSDEVKWDRSRLESCLNSSGEPGVYLCVLSVHGAITLDTRAYLANNQQNMFI